MLAGVALVLWIALCVTDGIDGYFARRQGATRSGAFLDPLADKVLVLGAMAALVANDTFWWVPVAIIAVREIGIQADILICRSERPTPGCDQVSQSPSGEKARSRTGPLTERISSLSPGCSSAGTALSGVAAPVAAWRSARASMRSQPTTVTL